jgi:hypothetical protein
MECRTFDKLEKEKNLKAKGTGLTEILYRISLVGIANLKTKTISVRI